jgi:hypothetical protein
MFDDHGNSIAITKLADSEAAAIAAFEVYSGLTASSEVSEGGGRTLRVRMVDQLKALELYGKAMGYFGERREITDYGCTPHVITVEFVEPPDPRSRPHRPGCGPPSPHLAREVEETYEKMSDSGGLS